MKRVAAAFEKFVEKGPQWQFHETYLKEFEKVGPGKWRFYLYQEYLD